MSSTISNFAVSALLKTILRSILHSILRVSKWEWLVLFSMIAIGIASRFFLAEQWNIKPVAAFVLFGGFFFRNALVAVAAAVAIMWLSDFRLGMYHGPLMISVYVSLALGALLGLAIRRRYGLRLAGWGWIPSFAGASLAMSTLFYLLTNGVVWWGSTWYPQTWSGLMECYVAAIPFFGRTLLGDFCFTAATVGTYAAVRYVLFPSPVVEPESPANAPVN